MSKRREALIYIVAFSALGFSVGAFLIQKDTNKLMTDAHRIIQQLSTDYHFAEIIDRYEDDSPEE